MCCEPNNADREENPRNQNCTYVRIITDKNGSPLFAQTIERCQEQILAIRLFEQLRNTDNFSPKKNDNIQKITIDDINKFIYFVRNLSAYNCAAEEDTFVKTFRENIEALVVLDYTYFCSHGFSIFGGPRMNKIYRVYLTKLSSKGKKGSLVHDVGFDLFTFFYSSLQYIYPFHLNSYTEYLNLTHGQDSMSLDEPKLVQILINCLEYCCLIPDWFRSRIRKIRLLTKLKDMNIPNLQTNVVDEIINRRAGVFPQGARWGLTQDKVRQLWEVFKAPIVLSIDSILSIEKAIDMGENEEDPWPQNEQNLPDNSCRPPIDPDEKKVIVQALESFLNDIRNKKEYDKLLAHIAMMRTQKSCVITPKAFYYLLLCELSIRIYDEDSNFTNILSKITKKKPNEKQCKDLLREIMLSTGNESEELLFKISNVVKEYLLADER